MRTRRKPGSKGIRRNFSISPEAREVSKMIFSQIDPLYPKHILTKEEFRERLMRDLKTHE